ncbi:RNase H domain-containing protein [Trichonephila clavipes]|nr:RNase H domain-containing protein [Trichonephila clavipes]
MRINTTFGTILKIAKLANIWLAQNSEPRSDYVRQLDTLRENCGIIRKQASTDGGVLWEVVRVNVVQLSPTIKIYTDGSRLSDRACSGIYIEKRGENYFCHRNPDFPFVFKSGLIAIEHGLEAVLNEQDFGDLWILSDSRGSLQHLYNWITVGDKAGVFILQKLTQMSEFHDVNLKWIPSHVNIFGNEQADLLAKEGCNASPPISSTRTYSEHQSRVKSEILKEWRTPPNHHWPAH